MTSLKRSRARAARARAEKAAPVVERMKEEEASGGDPPVIIVKSSRDSWARPEWLLPLGIVLAGVLAANLLGLWPFQPGADRTYTPEERERGKQQLLQIEAIRIQAVRESTGVLPQSLDEIQSGLDSVLRYQPLDDDRFLLGLIGDEDDSQEWGTLFDAAAGEKEEHDEPQ